MTQLVYLVDDDEDDCFLAQQALAPHADCQLRIFADGQQLITYLQQDPQVRLPTLILLDLNMPLLNGFETLQCLKEQPHWESIPVIVLTTSDHQQDKARCLGLGAEAFLTKPTDYASLSEVLAAVSTCWRSMLHTR